MKNETDGNGNGNSLHLKQDVARNPKRKLGIMSEH